MKVKSDIRLFPEKQLIGSSLETELPQPTQGHRFKQLSIANRIIMSNYNKLINVFRRNRASFPTVMLACQC